MERIKKLFINNNASAFILIFLVYAFVLCIIFGDLNLISGNLHDLWIPHLSAYALELGLKLHESFHTPFGFIYSLLNFWSLNIISNTPPQLSQSDLIVISSFLFSGILLALCVLAKVSLNKRNLFFFILVFLLSIVFQLRDVSKPIDIDTILWYGSYNNHLWSILLLQILTSLYFLKDLESEYPKKIKITFFILFNFICLFITLNYKINFFLASGLISTSVFFYLKDLKTKIIYIGSLGILLTSSVLAVEISTSYTYFSYAQDIYHAIISKKKIPLRYPIRFLIFTCIFFVSTFKLKNSELAEQKNKLNYAIDELKKIFTNLNQKPHFSKGYFLPKCYFILCICCGLFLGVAGDWQRPTIYFWITLAFYFLIFKKNKILNCLSYTLIIIFTSANIVSLSYIAKSGLKKAEAHLSQTGFKKFVPIKFIDDEYDFLIKNHIGAFDLIQYFDKQPTNTDFHLKLSSTYYHNKDKWALPYLNTEYIQTLNDAVTSIKKHKFENSDMIMMLEFVNPLPIILKTPIPENSYHWVHLGTTFSLNNINMIIPFIRNLDYLYIPTITVDGGNQTIVNCTFFEWNYKSEAFELVHSNIYGSLFINKNKVDQRGLETIPYNKEKLNSNCENTLYRLKNKN